MNGFVFFFVLILKFIFLYIFSDHDRGNPVVLFYLCYFIYHLEKEDIVRIEENRERNEREEEEPHTCNFVLFVDFCFCLLLLFVYIYFGNADVAEHYKSF